MTDAIPPVLVTAEIPALLVTDAIPPLLTALGKTARDVASVLRADRITARRGDTTFRNPIVRYINRHLEIGGHMIIPIAGGVLTVVREEAHDAGMADPSPSGQVREQDVRGLKCFDRL